MTHFFIECDLAREKSMLRPTAYKPLFISSSKVAHPHFSNPISRKFPKTPHGFISKTFGSALAKRLILRTKILIICNCLNSENNQTFLLVFLCLLCFRRPVVPILMRTIRGFCALFAPSSAVDEDA